MSIFWEPDGVGKVRVRVWGCRGSIASPGPDTVRHGGNTSCVEVRSDDDQVLILDAGTGARPLGVKLMEERPSRIDLLLTHLHVDHVEGLGAFAPIWSADTELHIWGPSSPDGVLGRTHRASTSRRRCSRCTSPRSRRTWCSTTRPPAVDGRSVRASPRRRSCIPAPRWATASRPTAVARLPHRPRTRRSGWTSSTSRASGSPGRGLADGADLLIHDCQYDEEEYPSHVGWGHTSTSQLAQFAAKAAADRLLLFHHDPMHGDDQLDVMTARVRELWGVDEARCSAAAEGMQLDV